MSTKKNKKLSTGIAGLDALLYGGIHIHNDDENNKGIVMLARGQHGVNKIHIAMQMCEGLYDSYVDEQAKEFIEEIIKKYELSIAFQLIKKNSKFETELLNKFEEIISSCDEKEKEKWEGHKEKCKSDYDNWIYKYAPKMLQSKVHELTTNAIDKIVNYNEYSENDKEKHINDIIDYRSETKSSDIFSLEIDLKKLYEEDEKECPKVLFISLNKDNNLLKSSYYDFYIQRLIKNVRMGVDYKRVTKSLLRLHSMIWKEAKSDNNSNIVSEMLQSYEFPSITGKMPKINSVMNFKKDIETGFIYYNDRTHGLHIRHQKGAVKDTGELLLCNRVTPDDDKVRIIGKDKLNEWDNSADGMTIFQKMMKVLDDYKEKDEEKYKDKNSNETDKHIKKIKKQEVDYIMIDGLSRLSKEELLRCPLNALSNKLRDRSIVSIITANENLVPSEINTDIVLDMDIRQSERADHQHTAMKISKCLYQKNAYGWHHYKMRNAGIEVIPSIHFQIRQRFLMDDAVSDATLSVDECPYPFWLNENETQFEDEQIRTARKAYNNNNKIELAHKSNLSCFILPKRELGEHYTKLISELESGENNGNHILFISFDKNRIEFYNYYNKNCSEIHKYKNRIHFFNFQPGYSHTDEILWTIDQQIQAIEKIARREIKENEKDLTTHYIHTHLVICDINYIHYAYPSLSDESLLLPAVAEYTKRHHMTNYIYATVNGEKDENGDIRKTELHKKEIETVMQMRRLAESFSN